jgi:hypothetical protein
MYFDIAQLTCDMDSRRILSSIDRKPRSAKEIAQACSMSISRCYRMIREMEEFRILRRAEVDGRETTYISNLRSIELSLEDDHIFLTVDYRDGTRTEIRLGPDDLERAAPTSIPQDLLEINDSSEPSTAS